MSSPLAIVELRSALDRLMEAVKEQFGEELTFDVDHYWDLLIPQAFDLDKEPELVTGQVSDDVESVLDFAASGDFVAIWHECEHIAGVLRAIAAKDQARF